MCLKEVWDLLQPGEAAVIIDFSGKVKVVAGPCRPDNGRNEEMQAIQEELQSDYSDNLHVGVRMIERPS